MALFFFVSIRNDWDVINIYQIDAFRNVVIQIVYCSVT